MVYNNLYNAIVWSVGLPDIVILAIIDIILIIFSQFSRLGEEGQYQPYNR